MACTDILVSASSYVQLISPARSRVAHGQGADDNTSSSRVTITSPGNSSSDHWRGERAPTCSRLHAETLASYLVLACSLPRDLCANILVSASSCVQLISPAMSRVAHGQGADDNTSSSQVTITSPGNSSSDHWRGERAPTCSRLHAETLASYLVLAFSLPRAFWYLYLSSYVWLLSGNPSSMHQTPYPLAARHHGTVCVYSMTCVTYQSNETGVRGFIMLTTAAPSRITMWASCALTVSWCGRAYQLGNT